MSNEAMTLAWKAADAPSDPGPMWVLIILADHGSDHAGEDFKAFPSVERIMERSKFKRSTVEAHLKTLVALGWISRRRRSRPDGKKGVYDYELHRDEVYRARLREAREAMVSAGFKPAGEARDLDHPCVKSTHGEPCSDLSAAMPEKPSEPCSKSAHHEPPSNPQDEPSRRAREVAALFEKVVEAAPASILKFYDRDEAFEALFALAADGVDVADLPAALGRMAADPAWRSRKHPPQLHTWLSQRQFEGWPAGGAAPDPAKATSPRDAVSAVLAEHAAPEADQAIWRGALAHLRMTMTEGEFGSWIRPVFIGQRGGALFLVALGATARDWIKARAWTRVQTAWSENGGAGRPLTLVAKHEFEAGFARQSEGVE